MKKLKAVHFRLSEHSSKKKCLIKWSLHQVTKFSGNSVTLSKLDLSFKDTNLKLL